jgi:hypothetical protein
MSSGIWPESLFELAFIPNIEEKLNDLALLAESEEWEYQNTDSDYKKPILYN